MKTMRFAVAPENNGERLDRFIAAALPHLSRSRVQSLCEKRLIRLGDRPLQKNYRVQTGDVIALTLPQEIPMQLEPQEMPLSILYEDEDLLILNKEQGLVVHPAHGNQDRTLANALLYRYGDGLSSIGGKHRPGIVHRLDKDTSGLLVVAKNDFTHAALSEQLKARSVARHYLAVVRGIPAREKGCIDTPIARHPVHRTRMYVPANNVQSARRAVTHYTLLERLDGYAYLELALETGRKHQIRVHMAWMGHPVVGDKVYGSNKHIPGLGGHCLHAHRIRFCHPRTEQPMEFSVDPPASFSAFLDTCRV